MGSKMSGDSFADVTTLQSGDYLAGYREGSPNQNIRIAQADMKSDFGSAQWTVDAASDNKTITSTAVNYLLIFTRQATAKVITLPAIGTAGRVIRINVTGSGAGNVSLAADSGETVGGFAATDWEWDGTGGLTLIDDGTNWQVLESGIWDVSLNARNWRAEKYTNGFVVRRDAYHTSDLAESDLWTRVSALIPNTDDELSVIGGFGVSNNAPTSRMVRTDSTTITVYYVNSSGVASATTTTSTASGTWSDTSDVSFFFKTENTEWTS